MRCGWCKGERAPFECGDAFEHDGMTLCTYCVHEWRGPLIECAACGDFNGWCACPGGSRPCHVCGDYPTVERNAVVFTVACRGCYEPGSLIGVGATPEAALDDWRAKMNALDK
ncbi:MAG: hypothetical protein JSV86_16975 [Gemmatimonadota bacterium]|nr:MAG: hypothetical protein JSV86_16975 [Gemmatimonadota bacterium]